MCLSATQRTWFPSAPMRFFVVCLGLAVFAGAPAHAQRFSPPPPPPSIPSFTPPPSIPRPPLPPMQAFTPARVVTPPTPHQPSAMSRQATQHDQRIRDQSLNRLETIRQQQHRMQTDASQTASERAGRQAAERARQIVDDTARRRAEGRPVGTVQRDVPDVRVLPRREAARIAELAAKDAYHQALVLAKNGDPQGALALYVEAASMGNGHFARMAQARVNRMLNQR